MSNITNELLEKEIVRLREENKNLKDHVESICKDRVLRLEEENERLKDQIEFVCKNRAVIQKSYAALEEKYNSFVDNATEINMGLLHVRAKVGSYPGVMISVDTVDDDEQLIALVEYNKDSGKIQVSTYDENSDEPRTIYEMKTDLKETAAECRRKVAECEAVLNEAYREINEYPEEVITIREEAELKETIEACNEFYDKFVKFTGEEV